MSPEWSTAFLRGLFVPLAAAMALALLPHFQPQCQPFSQRFFWFLIRYAFPGYCLLLLVRLGAWLLQRGG
ncbi:MAG: hypothetical protein PW734_02830 [Verrucomicrobium sp.]|nr:hypothetical protein [Verrucomicrobium sp.]